MMLVQPGWLSNADFALTPMPCIAGRRALLNLEKWIRGEAPGLIAHDEKC